MTESGINELTLAGSGLLEMLLGLAVVVGVILLAAWALRHVRGIGQMNSGMMKIVSVLALGTRERLLLVDIAGDQVVLAVSGQGIQPVHVVSKPSFSEVMNGAVGEGGPQGSDHAA